METEMELKEYLLNMFSEVLAERHAWWVKATKPTEETEQASLQKDMELLQHFDEALSNF